MDRCYLGRVPRAERTAGSMPATAAEPRPAELPLPGGRAGASVRLRPMLTATGRVPPAYLRRPERLATLRTLGVGAPRSEYRTLPIPAFLVEHPTAGLVLVDTGMHPSVADDPKENLGRLNGFLFRSVRMDPDDAVSARLRALGHAPSDVRVVVMTHLHVDHTSAMPELADATFVVERREWDAATARGAARRGYVRSHFDPIRDVRLVDFDGPGTDSYATFGRSVDLFGDGSVRLVSTPGHTVGHMSVVLRLAAREALLAGDAAYTMQENVTDGALPNPITMADDHLWLRSVREIQLYVRERPNALVIPSHDMEVVEGLDPVYE
jgi:N-acyl homoserine lactone hydrolase